jgi:glycosyltransferase involved in cell wall biosynthesis
LHRYFLMVSEMLKKRKRIAIIANNAGYTPDSAMGIYTWLLAVELSKRDFEIYYYCFGNYIDNSNSFENVKVFTIPRKVFWNKVISSIRDEKIDTVLYHYLATVWGWNGIPFFPPYYIFRLKLNGIKVISNFHETYIRWNFAKPWLFIQAITQRIAAVIILKSSRSAITSIDRYVMQLKRYNKSVDKIPIATNILPPLSKDFDENYRKSLREKLTPQNEILIVSFGNRDYSFLIENVNELLKTSYKIKVVIIGYISSAHVEKCTELITQYSLKDDIILTGLLSQDEVYSYLTISDIIFSFEKVENGNEGGASFKSGSLVASFIAGVPIITTKGDLNDDNFPKEVPLFLFDPNDNNSLLLILKDLIDNPQKRIEYGLKVRSFYNNYLSWEKITDKHEDIFQNC